jgi:hypothetical protein
VNNLPTPEVEAILSELLAYVACTASEYAPLERNDRYTQTIPFFGDIGSARILTIGVNPSAEEFAPARDWPSVPMHATALGARLVQYFESTTPHPWFEGWTKALAAAGVAESPHAHLDLSPRATYSFSRFTLGPAADASLKRLFLRMVESDLPYFSKFLDTCESARFVLMAGGVTNTYMDDYLARRTIDTVRFPSGKAKGGRAPVTRLSVKIGDRWIPGMFVGVGPSRSANWPLLAQRLAENSDYIKASVDTTPERM